MCICGMHAVYPTLSNMIATPLATECDTTPYRVMTPLDKRPQHTLDLPLVMGTPRAAVVDPQEGTQSWIHARSR